MDTEAVQGRRVSGRRWWVIAVVAITTVVAVAVWATVRSGGPAVIALGGAPDGAPMAAAEADDALGRADMAMWDPVEHRFELTDGARFSPGEARAWQLVPPRNLDRAAAELAETFGVDGVRSAPFADGSLIAGSEDGSGPSLWVDPTGSWYYSAPEGFAAWDCAEPSHREEPAVDPDVAADATDEGDGAVSSPALDEPCEPPAPPTGVPTASEARERATSLFRDLALPGRVVIAGVDAGERGAWVSGIVELDGRTTDLFVSASYGGEALLTSASGTLATATEADTYPTIGADEAVRRLEEQAGWWGGGIRPLPAIDTAEAMPEPAPVDPDEPVSSDDVVAGRDVTILPAPVADGEPQVVDVTLVSAQPVLLLQYDVNGTVWLLPGYRFVDRDGGEWHVLAIADDYLDTEEESEPAPVDPPVGAEEPSAGGGEDGAPGGDAGTPNEGGGQPGGDGEAPVGPSVPGEDGGVTPELQRAIEEVIGLPEDEAIARLEQVGAEIRIVARDGERFAVTDDLRYDRANLTIDGGIVVAAEGG